MVEIYKETGEVESRPKSKGGKWFDRITYAGIAGVGTFIITVPLANLFLKGGRFHSVNQGIERKLLATGLSKRLTDHATNTFATFWGGTAILIPVGIMEYFRTPIVKAFNRKLNDPTDPKSVEEAAPQTAGSIIKARGIATATVLTGFVTIETLVGKARFDNGLHRAGVALSKLFRTPVEVMKKGKLVDSLPYRIGRTGALDALATTSSAIMLYVGSHFFANRAEKKEEERVEKRLHPVVHKAMEAKHDAAKPAEPTATVSHARHESALVSEASPTAQL